MQYRNYVTSWDERKIFLHVLKNYISSASLVFRSFMFNLKICKMPLKLRMKQNKSEACNIMLMMSRKEKKSPSAFDRQLQMQVSIKKISFSSAKEEENMCHQIKQSSMYNAPVKFLYSHLQSMSNLYLKSRG